MPFLQLNWFISCYRHQRIPESSTTQCRMKSAPKMTILSLGTVAITVARRLEENAKFGVWCGQPYGRIDGRMRYCSSYTVAPHCSNGREFLDFYDPYATHMPGRMTPRKGFYKGFEGILKEKTLASLSHTSPSFGSELGEALEGISGERTTRRARYDEIHPLDPYIEKKTTREATSWVASLEASFGLHPLRECFLCFIWLFLSISLNIL